MIKAIVSDCFGVITPNLYSDPSISSVLTNDLKSQISKLSLKADRGLITDSTFTDMFLELTGIKYPLSYRLKRAKTKYNKEFLKYIYSLKKTYKTGLLTNVNTEYGNSIVASLDLQKHFDIIVISADTGYVKPQKEIYEIIRKKLGVAYKEIIFIDDTPSNVEEANALGMYGILYNSTTALKHKLNSILDIN